MYLVLYILLMAEAAGFLTFLGLRRGLSARCPQAEYFDLRYRDRILAKEREAPMADVIGGK